ncbi:MAG: glutamate--tRNA ligase, partial [Bacteroidales bacterium]|nr:glutamate--tRNA ligase [Candidatus Equibacterium intestinale]
GFPVFPLEWHGADGITMGYREEGYQPQAFINMLALLGWNPGTEQEIFSMEELCEQFSLEKVSKSGARFNVEKAKWFNAHYMRTSSDEYLASLLIPQLEKEGISTTPERAAAAVAIIKERVTFPKELLGLTEYMFKAPTSYDEKSVNKFWKAENLQYLHGLRDIVAGLDKFEKEGAEEKVREWITAGELPMGKIMNMLRIAIMGIGQGPDIFAICEFIGKEETLARIDAAFAAITPVQ